MANVKELILERVNKTFVARPSQWEYHKRGKNWGARLTGLDAKYGFARKFLNLTDFSGEKLYKLEDFEAGGFYEWKCIYFSGGGSPSVALEGIFRLTEITDSEVKFVEATSEEAIKALEEVKSSLDQARILVEKLVKLVGKDRAIELLKEVN